MSIVRNCDWCGRRIESHAPQAELASTITGRRRDRAYKRGGYLGHYHAGDRAGIDCYSKMLDAMELAHDAAPTLESIPVTTAQKLVHLRRAHTQTGTTPPAKATLSLPQGALVALAGLSATKAAEGAELLELHPDLDAAARRYLHDLARGAEALVGQLPAAVRGDLTINVTRLRRALDAAPHQQQDAA